MRAEGGKQLCECQFLGGGQAADKLTKKKTGGVIRGGNAVDKTGIGENGARHQVLGTKSIMLVFEKAKVVVGIEEMNAVGRKGGGV